MKTFIKTMGLLACLLFCLSAPMAEAAKKQKRPPVDRYASIVIEASTGYVLSERNADKKLYPASLTKIMTLYMTFDALDKGTLSRSQRIFVSKHASRQEPSSLNLENGEAIRVEDAILGVVTKSANDAAVVLAEAIGGSEERFARLMTQKARQLGMKNTNFVNASGLHNRNQISTARDMAILAQAILRNHARYYRYFSTASFTYQGYTYNTHNKLMNQYQGMDGIKTGFINASGFNLVASAVRNQTRLIGVVFGGQTSKSRNATMAKLLDQGFTQARSTTVIAMANKMQNKSLPVARPTPLAEEDTNEVFDSKDLVTEQGDTDTDEDTAENNARRIVASTETRNTPPLKTEDLKISTLAKQQQNADRLTDDRIASIAAGGNWAIQIGAYSTREAGLRALKKIKGDVATKGGTEAIAPLMTNRGMIYRARITGLSRNDAASACQALKSNCLILTVE